MALISLDAMDQAPDSPPIFHQRNVESSPVTTERRTTPTPLGYRLLRLMADVGFTKVDPFAQVAGVSGSTMHRLVYSNTVRPNPDTLLRVARAIATEGRGKGLETGTVEGIYQDLLTEAGYTIAAVDPSRNVDPLALKLDGAIGEGSTLPEADQELLRLMVGRLVDDAWRRNRRQAG
jgi:hypothetical protein